MSFNKDARDRIRRSTKRVEQAVTPQHRQRWRRQAPATGGGGGAAVFLLGTGLIAPNNGTFLGKLELERYTVAEGVLESTGNFEWVYNLSSHYIGPRTEDVFVLTAKVDGIYIVTSVIDAMALKTISLGKKLHLTPIESHTQYRHYLTLDLQEVTTLDPHGGPEAESVNQIPVSRC